RRLKVIGRHGVGYDKIDLAAARERGVALICTPFENTDAVAELVMALLLVCSRSIAQGIEAVRQGRWKEKGKIQSEELSGKKIGFVGYGRIARAAARLLTGAFAMPVYAHDPYVRADAWNSLEPAAVRCETLEDLFATCDAISLHVPLTPETEGLIGKKLFDVAKPGAILVNTARGGIVAEDDLYEALRGGRLMAAASDVFTQEPPDLAHPLFSLPNFIPTPHFGGTTRQALERVALAVVREVVACLRGGGDPLYRVI
ncbi:MAG: hypothetical protein LBS70_10560, partial [Candidatus Accumulibacter sp.]|nr:hypothetical protein [Accumulibacter sp.]